MKLVDRLTNTIAQEQEKALNNLKQGILFSKPKNFFEFFDILGNEFVNNFSDQMEKHTGNL